MQNKDWHADWQTFVRCVERDLDKGASDAELSRFYGGERIVWTGIVRELELDDEAPGVQLEMPSVEVRLSDGRFTKADYLYVHVDESTTYMWRTISKGTSVRFDATLSKGTDVFPGIRWSDLGEGKGYISIAATNATCCRT